MDALVFYFGSYNPWLKKKKIKQWRNPTNGCSGVLFWFIPSMIKSEWIQLINFRHREKFFWNIIKSTKDLNNPRLNNPTNGCSDALFWFIQSKIKQRRIQLMDVLSESFLEVKLKLNLFTDDECRTVKSYRIIKIFKNVYLRPDLLIMIC